MLNRKYFPFERNNYYFGKLLTAKDFEAEQNYFNDKRRFMNRLCGSNGIVSGLGVIMADDTSIIIQAGCATDASGREIIVPETTVVKLPTIDGFSGLSGNVAYLGISYGEKPADEVYSVMSGDDDTLKHNKIKEQYKLTLTDENLVAAVASPMDEFVSKSIIYSDSEVELVQYTPKYVPEGCNLTAKTVLTRNEPGTGEYSFSYKLSTPGFANGDGETQTEISVNNKKLSFGEEYVLEAEFTPDAHLGALGGTITFKIENFSMQKNDEVFSLKKDIAVELKPINASLRDHYLQTYYEKSMDKVLTESFDERLWIAKIRLIRKRSAVIIDTVAPAPYDQYSYNPQQLMMLQKLSSYYPEARKITTTVAVGASADTMSTLVTDKGDNSRVSSCGVYDFPLGLNYDTKEVLYSDEIMHGLGKGPVYVDFGVEIITLDTKSGNSSEIITGDSHLFEKDASGGEERLYDIEKAVKILPERGTFVMALLPGKTTGLISIRVRWFAVKSYELTKMAVKKETDEKMIVVNPDTIVLPPKGTAHISPIFLNMPSEPCNFILLEADGGEVDNNGIYTAPSKEGAYEIRVEAISDPTIFTHVFAIVTQKKKNEK